MVSMNISKNRVLFIIALSLVWLLPVAAVAAPMRVFVSIAPEKWLVDQLGGEKVRSKVLLDRGQDPHSFQPTPGQITALYRAKIYFTVGMEFERQISSKLEHSQVEIVDCTRLIRRIPIAGHGGTRQQEEPPAADWHDHALDPHVWLTPVNLEDMAKVMAGAMIAADPDHADLYRSNLTRVSHRLAELHREIRAILQPWKGATLFVFHPAFGYFAREYQLQQHAVEVEGKSPAPRQLYALIKQAKREKVKVIFVQPQFDRKSAAMVAQAIGGRVVPLDPLAGDVVDNLRTMAAAIDAALK
jgi:zinc transport system substrate-binding protein